MSIVNQLFQDSAYLLEHQSGVQSVM